MARSEVGDEVLVASALREERASFSELLDRHRRMVLALCARMLGDAILAEDVYQEASVRAWINLSRLRMPGSFGSWFAGIALNICHEWIRRSGTHPWAREILAGITSIRARTVRPPTSESGSLRLGTMDPPPEIAFRTRRSCGLEVAGGLVSGAPWLPGGGGGSRIASGGSIALASEASQPSSRWRRPGLDEASRSRLGPAARRAT